VEQKNAVNMEIALRGLRLLNHIKTSLLTSCCTIEEAVGLAQIA